MTSSSRPSLRPVDVSAEALAAEVRPYLRDDDPAPPGHFGHNEIVTAHYHRLGQLVYPVAGVLVTTTGRGTWVTPADEIAWTPPGFVHQHRTYGETELRVLAVPVHLCGLLPTSPGVFAADPLVQEGLRALTDGRPFQRAVRDRLRRVVVDQLTIAPERHLHLPQPADDRLRVVTDALHADPASPATLAELGHEAGASERTLSRLFRAELGMSFHQWRTLLRIQHALLHLTQGHSVTETTIELGWSNPTSFIEAFSAVVGTTPGRYRPGTPNPAEHTILPPSGAPGPFVQARLGLAEFRCRPSTFR